MNIMSANKKPAAPLLVIIGLAVLCSSLLAYNYAHKDYLPLRVKSFEWERKVQIQRYQTMSYSNVSYLLPGAYNVDKWDAGHLVFDFDQDGMLCGSHWESDIRYSYLRDEWRPHRELHSRGSDRAPHWPAYQLEPGPLGVSDAVCATPERYIVHLSDGETDVDWETNIETWYSLNAEEQVIAVVNGFGKLVDVKRAEDSAQD